MKGAATVPRRDRRRAGVLLTLLLVLVGGFWIDQAPVGPAAPPVPRPLYGAELTRRFEQAVLMLHAKQYVQAATAWQRVLVLAPELPEANVNMGYALLGLQRHQEALAYFDHAISLRPAQANAYYGLALAWEAAGDRPLAIGAMRSYLHLARQESPAHLSRARAALWEWQAAAAPKAAADGNTEPR